MCIEWLELRSVWGHHTLSQAKSCTKLYGPQKIVVLYPRFLVLDWVFFVFLHPGAPFGRFVDAGV